MFSELAERIGEHYTGQLPFVVYRKPGNHRVETIFQNDDELLYVKDYSETGFVFAPFKNPFQTVLMRPDQKFQVSCVATKPYDAKSIPESDLSQKNFHVDLVRKGIDEIKKGTFKKVVLSRKLEVACTISAIKLFQRLISTYENAFCYLWYHPKIGTWLGATPEILLQTNGQQLTTMSLAGTRLASGKSYPIWTEKEVEEQRMVTTYISEALRNKVVRLKTSEVESSKTGNLWHLRTKVSGILKEDNIIEIVTALHPTPAVCGMPLLESRRFILDHEQYDREYYTGFLGELNFKKERRRQSSSKNIENKAYKTIKNTSILYVNLRCMKIQNNKASIYVGGGITQASIPYNEWEETVAKGQVMLKVLGSE